MNDIDANKILISKKEKYGNYDSFQHFIGYNDNNVIKPVYLELPQMKIKIKTQSQCFLKLNMFFKYEKLFKNCNKIWKKIEELMDIEFNTKPTYGDDEKYKKTKIKASENNITTNCYHKKGSKKVPKDKIPNKCLSIIILDSIIYDCNWTRTQNHLVLKRTLNHLAKLAYVDSLSNAYVT